MATRKKSSGSKSRKKKAGASSRARGKSPARKKSRVAKRPATKRAKAKRPAAKKTAKRSAAKRSTKTRKPKTASSGGGSRIKRVASTIVQQGMEGAHEAMDKVAELYSEVRDRVL